jgi:drug/metabolite transporter (DMT)-like permease
VAAPIAGGPVPLFEAFLWAAVAGLGGTFGLGAFFVALGRAPMSLVAPVAGVLAAGIPAAVGIAFGDALPPHRVLGLALAIVAVVLVSLSGPAPDESSGRVTRLDRLGLFLSVAAGIGFAAFYLLIDRADAVAGGVGPLWLLVPVRLTGIVTIGALLMVRRPPVPRLTLAAAPVLALAGLGDVGGNLFFVLAQGVIPFSVAAVLSSMYPVVTVLLAAGLLHERLARVQLVGVAVAVGAIVLIPV